MYESAGRYSPDKIHAKKGLLILSTLSAPNCLISDAHLMLVSPHLSPPQPGWSAQHNRIGMGCLLNFDVRALLRGARQKGDTAVIVYLLSVRRVTFSHHYNIHVENMYRGGLKDLLQLFLLHCSLLQGSRPPPGPHHRACRSSFRRRCAVPGWQGAEPQRCHRKMGTFWWAERIQQPNQPTGQITLFQRGHFGNIWLRR